MIAVNFLWHMHQPDYRPAGQQQAILPWVRLHAVRGYLDLLSALQAHPQAHCTVNFSGILLEQLLEYGTARDLWAELSLRPAAELTTDEAQFVVDNFFSANERTLIRPFPRYAELLDKRNRLRSKLPAHEVSSQFSDEEITDLIVWFNLAWIGFYRRRLPEMQALFERGRDFNHDDQQQLITVHDQLVAEVLPGYAALQAAGGVELSFTPYHHPILPLLIDCQLGTKSPSSALPDFSWPQDAEFHVRRGIELYEQAFGQQPLGAWPAEGSVSDDALGLLAAAGLDWAATDQQNLPTRERLGHLTPWGWKKDQHKLAMFFRDTRLSDHIGFDYASWKPAAAAGHLLDHIAALGRQSPAEQPVVSIILDGENPWEAFPDGGEGFLNELFSRLVDNSELQALTPSEILQNSKLPELDHVDPGSWIMGNFDIWTKDEEARQAWRLLARARTDVAASMDKPEVAREIYAAEASDWFWWYGDTFQSDQKMQFDELFRGHLIAAYDAAGLEAPGEMHQPIGDFASDAPIVVSSLIEPVIDGRQSHYFEWHGAAEVGAATGMGAMALAASSGIETVHFAFSEDSFCLRIQPSAKTRSELAVGEATLRVYLQQDEVEDCVRFNAAPGRRRGSHGRIAVGELIEVAVALSRANLVDGGIAQCWIELRFGRNVDRFPLAGTLRFIVPAADSALSDWIV